MKSKGKSNYRNSFRKLVRVCCNVSKLLKRFKRKNSSKEMVNSNCSRLNRSNLIIIFERKSRDKKTYNKKKRSS